MDGAVVYTGNGYTACKTVGLFYEQGKDADGVVAVYVRVCDFHINYS